MYVKIALFGLVHRKGRTFFTALSIAIAVSMAILLVSVGVTLKQGTNSVYESDVDYWIIPEGSSVTDLITNSGGTMLGNVHPGVEKIMSGPGVKGATPVLNRVVYASTGEKTGAVLGIGYFPGMIDSLPSGGMTPGDPYFKDGEITNEAVINEKTADLFSLETGDLIYLGGSKENLKSSFKVVSVINEIEYSLSPVVMLHLSELQEITGNIDGDRANRIVVHGSNSPDLLNDMFPEDIILSSMEYQAYTVASDKKILATAIAVSVVSIFIAVLFVSSTMILSLNEKQQEFAVMSAMGISRFSIIRIILYEVILLSLFGGIMAIVLSSLGGTLLNTAAYYYFKAGNVAILNPVLYIACAGLAVMAGIFSGLIPVFMTGQKKIAERL